MKWRYSLRWTLPRTPCPGPQELVSEVVEAGQPAPESVMARWVARAGYAGLHEGIIRRGLNIQEGRGNSCPPTGCITHKC
ncbi:threonine dehydrogenase (plasmid) [Escherichia coli]|uniref:Threonine dehydrogenase n=1 Tax=Escherichia coli TaxID=562 RepID=A0A2H4TLB9_ECOLX|nr:threonine dehydrogenase [Escherichia coli]WEG95766.1 hypothetical protein ABFCBFJH_00017 [Escherichia coli]